MKTYPTIDELKADLNLDTPSIHPEFHIYKHSELSETQREALEPHTKNFFSIEFIADESWSMKVGHISIEDMTQCMVFNSPHQLFSVDKYSNDAFTRGYTVFFSELFFLPLKHQFQIQKEFPYFKLNSQPFYKLEDGQQKRINAILEQMHKEVCKGDSCSIEISRSYLTILLNTIKRFLKDSSKPINQTRYDSICSRFEELILSESSTLKTISDYADRINITPAYLSECTRKSAGLPAKKILAGYSVLRAKSLIRQTDLSIDEIAREMGFSETTNFIKFFKNLENMTPNTYRNLPK